MGRFGRWSRKNLLRMSRQGRRLEQTRSAFFVAPPRRKRPQQRRLLQQRRSHPGLEEHVDLEDLEEEERKNMGSQTPMSLTSRGRTSSPTKRKASKRIGANQEAERERGTRRRSGRPY